MASSSRSGRQYSLRTVLLLVMLGALLLVIAGIGGISLRRLQTSLDRAYSAQREFATRQLEARTEDFLEVVEQQSAISRQFVVDGVHRVEDPQSLVRHWVSVMNQKLQLSSLSISLDADGQMLEVSRLSNGRISVRHLAPDPVTGLLAARDYRQADFPHTPYHVIPDKSDGDPRGRPWYRQAAAAVRPVWSPTYEFISAGGYADRRGVTHATPFYNPDGSLRGVLTTDIALDELNRILAELIPPSEGVGLIVERLADGKPRLLAQSDVRSWVELLPEELRARLGGDNIGPMLAGKLGETWLREGDGTQIIDVPSGELLMSQVMLDTGLKPGERPPWALVLLSPPNAHLLELKRDVQFISGLILFILLASTVLSLALAQSISRPLASLASQFERFGRLELDLLEQPASTIKEVRQLSRSSQSMALGLRSFLKYVPASLVRQLVAGDEEAHLGGEERDLTIMFVDIAGFTQLSENLAPTELVELLGSINEMLAREIESRGGTLDKFLGDGLMAFWGAPDLLPGHARAACDSALAIIERLDGFNAQRRAAQLPELRIRIGLASGSAVVGNFGSSRRISYTAVGDVVNTASALEQMNKVYGTTVLLDPGVQAALGGSLPTRAIDNLKLKGKQQALMIYELLPRQTEQQAQARLRELVSGYSFALQAYIAGQWAAAEGQFATLMFRFPEDEPSQVLLERCRRFRSSPPPGWDGAFEVARISPTAG